MTNTPASEVPWTKGKWASSHPTGSKTIWSAATALVQAAFSTRTADGAQLTTSRAFTAAARIAVIFKPLTPRTNP